MNVSVLASSMRRNDQVSHARVSTGDNIDLALKVGKRIRMKRHLEREDGVGTGE
jgi:hypothetical protein